MKRAIGVLILVVGLLAGPGVAEASWTSTGAGSAGSQALTMPTGARPTVTASGRNVTVSWAASAFVTGQPVAGYTVRRLDPRGEVQAGLPACSDTVAGPSCTEAAVPPGSWAYAVTPRQGTWAGSQSAASTSVDVGSPSLAFASSTTLTALPANLRGSLAGFVTGQTVAFSLDERVNGSPLAATVTPRPIPASGAASITITIPAGTSNGSHVVYAMGTQGDVGSATITVAGRG